MSNSLLTIDNVTRESLEVLHEKCSFIGSINRDYDDSFAKTGAKQGATLRIRKPNQYTVRTGRVMNVQDQAEESTTITVATQKGVDMAFNSVDLALSIDAFRERYIEPAMSRLAADVEQDCLTQAIKATYQTVGTAGTVIGASDITALGLGRAKLNQQACPMDSNRYVQIDSVTMANIINNTKGLFHDGPQIKEAFREGYIGRNAMATFYENEKTWTLTNGDDVAWAVDDTTALAAYTDADGVSTLNMDAMGTTATVGAVFTIADLYDVHPETKQAYSHPKQFTITSIGTISGNQAEVTFSPTIRIAGAKQNCYLASGDITDLEDNVVTLHGSASTGYRQNLMYHKDAFTVVTADLPLMADAISCVRRKKDNLSMRVWQASDIKNDEMYLRFDILYGFLAQRPEWAARLSN